MLAIVSFDGGDREDCNIFYAGYFVIHDDDVEKFKTFSTNLSDTDRATFGRDFSAFEQALQNAGIQYTNVDVEYVIGQW